MTIRARTKKEAEISCRGDDFELRPLGNVLHKPTPDKGNELNGARLTSRNGNTLPRFQIKTCDKSDDPEDGKQNGKS